MRTRDILLVARELIADKSRWCQGGFARERHGGLTSTLDSDATKWCAVGALGRAEYDTYGLLRNDLAAIVELNSAANELYQCDIVNVNDRLGHAPVLACYDAALERLEARS